MVARTRELGSADRYTVSSEALPPGATVGAFRAVEAMSTPYRLELAVVLAGDRAVDLAACIGAPLALTIDEGTDDLAPLNISGVIRGAALVDASGVGATARTVLALSVSPRLASLELGQRSRIFTHLSFPDILRQVLREAGLESASELRLSGVYGVEEHVCQYRESDLAFLSRWMEREGIYYFFTHAPDASGVVRERVIFTDDRSAHERLESAADAGRSAPPSSARRPAVRFRASADAAHAPEGFRAARSEVVGLPTRVIVTDHDYLRPGLALVGRATATHRGSGDVSVWGARAFSIEDASRLARVRAEALTAAARHVVFEGSERAVRPGFLFELDDTSGAERADVLGAWLALEVERSAEPVAGIGALAWPSRGGDRRRDAGSAGAQHRVTVRALAAGTQHRALARTPWPRVAGFESGVVDGPADSTYAQIDDHGRYAIRMHFDASAAGRAGGRSSTRVRMAQPHGGGAEGMHFPLRRGTEVLVQFQDGDPDRPLIGAVLPNASNPSPVTKGNASRNVIQTGGATRIEIEDADGAQHMNTSTPVMGSGLFMGAASGAANGHNVELASSGSGAKSFGAHMDRFVGGPKSDHVVGPVTRAYDAPYVTSVAGDAAREYGASYAQTVKGSAVLVVTGSLSETVMGAAKETLGSSLNESVVGAVSESYDADQSLRIGGPQLVTIGGPAEGRFTSGLGVHVDAATSRHDVTGEHKVEAPDVVVKALSAFKGRGDVLAKLGAPDVSVAGDNDVNVESGAVAGVAAPDVVLSGASSISLGAPQILVKGGDVRVRGGTVSFHGAELHLTSDGRAVASASGTTTVRGGPNMKIDASTILLNVSATPGGLGTAVAARLALNPPLAASVTALEQAGWTIEWGEPGEGSYFDRARKVLVLDPSLASDPEAATRELARLAEEAANPDHGLHGQEEPMSCVVAAGQMIIHTNTGQDLPESGLRDESSSMDGGYDPVNGTRFSTLEELLENHGVDASSFGPVSLDELAAATDAGSPAMLAITNGDGSGHAVVVDGYTTNPDGSRTFHVRDPWPPNQGATYDVHESDMGSDFYGDGSGAGYSGSAITTTGGGA